jgi:hypothetical protein
MADSEAKDPGEQEFIQAHYALAQAALPPQDHRDQALMQADSALAQATLRQQTARARKIVEERPELLIPSVQEAIAAEQKYEYPAELRIFGLLFTILEVRFYISGEQPGIFKASAGGLTNFIGIVRGASFLNYPYDEIRGWEARFEAQFLTVPPISNINWWGLHGEYIGSFVGTGVSIGSGIVGGQGKFQ